MNIYPSEIEGALKEDPRVGEVLVYGFLAQFGTQIGMKLVGKFSSLEEVRQLCVELLPAYQIPSRIELLDELPKNGSGKIIRRKTVWKNVLSMWITPQRLPSPKKFSML